MTPEELAAAPEWQEMPPAMAKRLVAPSARLRYKQALKQDAKEEEEYKEACGLLFLRVLAILPQSAVNIIKAFQDLASMDSTKDILALRNAVLAPATNDDTRLYTPFQSYRSVKDVANLHHQRKNETVHTYSDRCKQTFYAHQEAGHGWPLESHYQKEVKHLWLHPDHDCFKWEMGDSGYMEPQGDEPQALFDYCADAFQAMVFINGLFNA